VRIKDIGNRPVPASIRDLVSRMGRGRGPLVRVERRQLPYWQERGWTREGNVYHGNYQTPFGAFAGHIVEHRSNHIDFYFYSPSQQIQAHSHWVCFQHHGNDWYLVHMGTMPKDVSSGILTIERLIAEAYEF
jgi:hypothetical protein